MEEHNLEINQHLCKSKNKARMQFSAHLESERRDIIMSESLVVHIAIAEFQEYGKNWKGFFVTLYGILKFRKNVIEFLVSKGKHE